MKRVALTLSCLLALAVAMPAAAQNKKKPPADKVPDVDAEKALQPGDISGKVHTLSGNSLTLRVEYERLELKKGSNRGPNYDSLIRQQQAIARAQQRLATARSPRQMASALRSLQQANLNAQRQALRQAGRGGSNPFTVKKETKDFVIELSPDAKIRTSWTPAEFDDMGNLKKLTAAEKKELKGDPKLPGYKADLAALKAGQKATVHLARVKDEDDKGTALRATMVLITEESTQPTRPGKKNK
jgi:hypothetical protein